MHKRSKEWAVYLVWIISLKYPICWCLVSHTTVLVISLINDNITILAHCVSMGLICCEILLLCLNNKEELQLLILLTSPFPLLTFFVCLSQLFLTWDGLKVVLIFFFVLKERLHILKFSTKKELKKKKLILFSSTWS